MNEATGPGADRTRALGGNATEGRGGIGQRLGLMGGAEDRTIVM